MIGCDWDPSALVRDYGDVAGEAGACRAESALFDFSFVSRAELRGPRAEAFIGSLTRRPMTGLAPGRIRYALREAPEGHLLSDLTVWKHGPDHFEVMSGASDDIVVLGRHADAGTTVTDLSAGTAILAVQGPAALRAFRGLGELDAIARLSYFGFCRARLSDHDCLVGRLGYSGEPGFEIIAPREAAADLWTRLERHARPAGFAAADMLRIEAGFVLFANEFRVPVGAHEIGLGHFAGEARASSEAEIALVCFCGRADADLVFWRPPGPLARPTRSGTLVATSACESRAASGALGLGYALSSDVRSNVPLADPTAVFRDIELVELPFYDPKKTRPRRPWSDRPADRVPARNQTLS